MPKISVLPDFLASQIAAGEVVERPSSVVKELVENSIDAGATQIEIAIGADCRDLRIADNGCGMSPDDACLAFQRHATSKLNKSEDLFQLTTLGFRGEALPSIASVSKLTCLTRTQETLSGTKLELSDGKITATEAGCSIGTIIEICDLFYNVPARLKFLKKHSTEFAHISETIHALALSYPKVTFQLLNQGEVVLKTSGSGKLAEVMHELNMISPREDLIPVSGMDMRFGMAVYGYVSRPPLCRGDRKGIISIVNNRPVKCQLTYKALDYAFSDLIPKGKHPIAVIAVTLDPNQIDVNVHPTKKEIRYSNSSDVFLAIQKSLVEATHKFPNSETTDYPRDSSYINNSKQSQTALLVKENVFTDKSIDKTIYPQSNISLDTEKISSNVHQLGFRDRLVSSQLSRNNTDKHLSSLQQNEHIKENATLPLDWKLVGYIFNTYMLFETNEGFKIVEQHIAHERLIYEKLLKQQNEPGKLNDYVQHLVISAPLNLSPSQQALLKDNLELLSKLGFAFDINNSHISCTQIPLELANKDYTSNIQNIMEQLLCCDNANFSLEATKSIACQSAIKNGMVLTQQEITDLVADWLNCPRNDTCPHGRPISLNFSRDKLFQLFHPD